MKLYSVNDVACQDCDDGDIRKHEVFYVTFGSSPTFVWCNKHLRRYLELREEIQKETIIKDKT